MNSGNTVVWDSDPDAPWNEEDVTIYDAWIEQHLVSELV